ncbi:unnamed protein product [Penicillium manginii]
MATTAALPLTTTFSPPADCTTDSYHVLRSTSSNYSWWWTSLGTSDWSTCFPSGYQPTGYFSPGVCPEGYAPVDQTCISSDEETQATCCPRNLRHQREGNLNTLEARRLPIANGDTYSRKRKVYAKRRKSSRYKKQRAIDWHKGWN